MFQLHYYPSEPSSFVKLSFGAILSPMYYTSGPRRALLNVYLVVLQAISKAQTSNEGYFGGS